MMRETLVCVQFVLERPRRDTNGGSETEVTVTSKQPSKYRKKQGDRKETEKRREGRILLGRWQRLGAGAVQPSLHPRYHERNDWIYYA